jgi:5-hydroxyisourate hydrolase
MITTHVLDTTRGKPAAGVKVTLYAAANRNEEWRELGRGTTDDDGRLATFTDGSHPRGWYRLSFEIGEWFNARGIACFHPVIDITFDVQDAGEPVHVPVLLSPFGYTTYRGS